MEEKEVIELLRSGNFTVAYHDNDAPCLYKGKWKYEDLEEEKEEVVISCMTDGYCPYIVELLVKALGGVTDSV